jgi:hypothetical protein
MCRTNFWCFTLVILVVNEMHTFLEVIHIYCIIQVSREDRTMTL